MRLIWVLLLFLICAGSSPAQVPSNNIAPPDVEILKYKWSKGSSRDSRLQPRPFMDASTPSPSGPIFDRNQDSHTPLRTQTQSSSGGFYSGGRRVRYVYSLKIKNNGAKTIKAIEWEHVFLDPDNHREVNRVLLRSYHKVSVSKSATLEGETNRPPALVVSVGGLQKDKRSPFDEHVEIKCVLYSDGSFWKDPTASERVCGNPAGSKHGYRRFGTQ